MRFQQLQIESIPVFYPVGEEKLAKTMISVYKDVTSLLASELHLAPPHRLRLYITISWFTFVFHSAPLYLKFLRGFLLPLYFRSAARTWKWSAGWTLLCPSSRPAVGVKPPRLIARSARTVGKHIYYKASSDRERFRHTVCHELVHAFTAHLKLPYWLNEGLAMWFVDRWVGNQTVKPSTLTIVSIHEPRRRRVISPTLPSTTSKEDFVYHYARAYWIIRLLRDKDRKLLPQFVESRMSSYTLDEKLAEAVGLDKEDLWRDIDGLLYDHFNPDGVV